MDYERFYPAAPTRVLSALIKELCTKGQVLEIGEFGRAITFMPAHSPFTQGRHLVARAHAWQEGTLVQVTEEGHPSLDDDDEFMDLLTVLGEVSRSLNSSAPPTGTTYTPIAHGSLPQQRQAEAGGA